MRILRFCLCFLLTLAAVFAADVTGKWTAQVPGRDGQPMEMVFNLKAAGAELTGTVVSPRGEQQIAEGKIDGDSISFSTTLEFGGNTMKLIYKGKVAGDEIKFTREREGQDGPPREFTAKRTS
jgi:hypothetical protein